MNPFHDGGFAPGRASNRPPLFCGTNFTHWSDLMKMYLIDIDYDLWRIVRDGPRVPMKTQQDGTRVPKDEEEFDQSDLEMIGKSYRAINVLYCALNGEEYERVRDCKTAKAIWDKLVVTYEGTSDVKDSKISIYNRKYELFKMLPDENVKSMFTRFTLIVNTLSSLGKVYTNEEKVRKILKCLPRAVWGPKVTAIEEAQDLKTLPLENLLGKLITHEMTLKEDEDDAPSTSKNVALKAKVENDESDDSDDESEDDPYALISRGLARILKMKKKYPNKSKGSSYSSKHKSKYSNSVNKVNKLTCYECGETDHLVKDCPKKKREKYQKKDDKRKALITSTWSDSDSSDSDEDHANLCLMADSDRQDIEVMVKNLLSCPKEILADFLTNIIISEENTKENFAKLKEAYSK